MANYSVIPPGLHVSIVAGPHHWEGVIRARLPDHLYVEMISDEKLPSDLNEAVLQWHKPPLVWTLPVRLHSLPSEERLVSAEIAGAPKPIENRQTRRFAWQWPVDVQWSKWPVRHLRGITEDVSLGGCRCRLPSPLDENREYTLVLSGPQKVWRCRVAIFRQRYDEHELWGVTVFLWKPGDDTEEWLKWLATQG